MNLTSPHISCDGRFRSKGEIITSIYLCPKYPVSVAICSNLERLCYISSPDLAWVLWKFRQRLWNKIPHRRDVTRWAVSTEVYKTTLGSFCNVREVGIRQRQSTWQYFASMSVPGNTSATGTFSSAAQVFPHFWEGQWADRRAGAEVTSLSPWSLSCYSKMISKTVGNKKKKRHIRLACFVLLQPCGATFLWSARSTDWLVA